MARKSRRAGIGPSSGARVGALVLMGALSAVWGMAGARGQEADTAPAALVESGDGSGATVGRETALRLITQANPMLWPLAVCSVVALGFSMERLFATRRGRVIPRDFTHRFMERLSQGKLDRERALELCKARDCPIARVFAHAARYWGHSASEIRQAVAFDGAGEILDLKRNVRVLNGIATLAPLLGLLGTVVGLIESFESLGGKVGTAKGDALAHGISLALVATAAGLTIAAFAVCMQMFLSHRIDRLAREMDDKTRAVIDWIAGDSTRMGLDRRLGAGAESSRGAEVRGS